MNASPLYDAVVAQILLPGLLVLLSTAGAWLLTKLPGPVREFLQSGTHQRDMELLVGAMARKAAAAVVTQQQLDSVLARSQDAVRDVIDYAVTELPGTVAKLKPSTSALGTMAQAAISAAISARLGKK